MVRTFPTYPGCPVCGDPAVNPATLNVRWRWDAELACVRGTFTPDHRHTGYAGIMHGGVLSALLDECLAWAAAVQMRTYCVTGELIVRFKAPATLGQPFEMSARAATSRGPYARVEADVRDADGVLIATAEGTYVALPRAQALTMRDALRLTEHDFDVLGL